MALVADSIGGTKRGRLGMLNSRPPGAPVLHLSDVPRDSPHKGQSMWVPASITLGTDSERFIM